RRDRSEALRRDGAEARGPRRRRLQRAGSQPDVRHARGGSRDRLRGGPARRLDPRHHRPEPGAARGRAGGIAGHRHEDPARERIHQMTDLTLADVDRDGALEEALAALHGSTRAGLLRGALLGGAALLAASAAPAEAVAGDSDVAILNYALSL